MLRVASQGPSSTGKVREWSEPPCKNPSPSVLSVRLPPALRAWRGTLLPQEAGWEHKQATVALARAPQFYLRRAASICCRINTR